MQKNDSRLSYLQITDREQESDRMRVTIKEVECHYFWVAIIENLQYEFALM